MEENTINKLREYNKKQKELVKSYTEKQILSEKLVINYQKLWKMSDSELRRDSNAINIFENDPVYKKIWNLWLSSLGENDNLSNYLDNFVNQSNGKFSKREMKEEEYDYFYSNSSEKILKDKRKELYKKSLSEKILVDNMN